jgi:hypothetical protein
MLNIDTFRDLCRRVCIEKDLPKRQNLRDTLRRMLRIQQLELHAVEKNPGLKAN